MQAAMTARAAVTGGVAWMAIALAVGVSGVLVNVPAPQPQLIIVALTAATIWMTTRGSLRVLVESISTRALVGFHGVRLVGAVFLVLSAQGELSPVFANRAGWGDIAAAIGAIALVATGDPATRIRRSFYLVWSALAILDLLVAVGTASIVALRGDTPGIQALFHAPFILVPTFFVPLLLASHVLIVRRLLWSNVS